MTPGYNIYNDECEWTHLGGNADDRSDAWVDAWREAFIAERVRLGVAGLGMYNFSKNNARPSVVRATVSAVAEGIARLLRRVDPSATLARL